MTSLRASGKTEEQIEQWFPKSIQEKRKEQLDNYQELKQQVETLKERLAEIEEHVKIPPKQAQDNKDTSDIPEKA